MFLGLVQRCYSAVFCFSGPRRAADLGSASVPACLLLAFAILLQPGLQSQHAEAAARGLRWSGGGREGSHAGDGTDVQLFHDYREPVLVGVFHWSEFGAWTTCTASCGTGVEGRRRVCVDERNNEVPAEYCSGYQRQYRLCRIQNCPNSFDLGYRASRCQEIAPRGHRWKPYYPSERDGYSPCTLICYNEERQGEVRVAERDVPSGTRCAKFRDGSPETGVCIEGICLSVGCDGYLNSTTYPDRCGVCGGDGSSCALVSNEIITENLQVGYTDILEIPSGATNIKIAETYSIQSYLALVNLDGHYFLNGDVQRVEPVFSNSFQAAGSYFRYQRRNLYNRGQWEERESLTAKGPTNETLHLQILNFIYGSTNILRYEYVIPLEMAGVESEEEQYSTQAQSLDIYPTPSKEKYTTDASINTLMEAADISQSIYPVNMTHIDEGDEKLLEIDTDLIETLLDVHVRNRTTLPVRNKWNQVYGDNVPSNMMDPKTSGQNVWTESERFLNMTQVRTLTNVDVQTVTVESKTNTTRDVTEGFSTDAHLQDVVLQVSAPDKILMREPLDDQWEEGIKDTMRGEWSKEWPEIASLERSGSGRIVLDRENVMVNQTRQEDITAMLDEGSDLVYGPPYKTEDSTHDFTTTAHDLPHGETATLRTTMTFAPQTDEAPSPTHDNSPDIKQHEGDNKVGFESQVAEDMETSDSNYEEDLYSSEVENGLRLTTLVPSSVTSQMTSPSERTSTSIASTATTAIPTTIMQKTTSLKTVASHSQTTFQSTYPETLLPINMSSTTTTELSTKEPIPSYLWRVTDTMPCSATCLRGIIRNYAYCVNGSEQQVDDTMCDKKTKPDVIAKECTGKPCEPRWEVGSWSNCLGDCEASYRFRTVHCWLMMGKGLDTMVSARHCNGTVKPNVTRPCQEQNCRPQWIVSDWSACSTPCNPGRQTRQVTCSEISGCDMRQRPERERVCNRGPCSWSTSSWTQCSGSCTVQSRRVFCMAEPANQESRRVEDSFCSGTNKPLTTQLCGGGPCHPKWVPQTWGRCEGSCNNPFSRRRIVCMGIMRDGRTLTLPNGRCVQERPVNHQRCIKSGCPHRAEWKTSIWKPCSVTCGSGWQTREVRCLIGGRISDMCGALPRPASRRACNRTPCSSPQAIQGSIGNGNGNGGGGCQDSRTADCNLIVQASLCRYPRYKRTCCRSCANVAARSATRGRQ